MTPDPAGRSEWFTPVWVVPALFLAAVIVFAIVNGSAPDIAASVPPTVTR